MATIGAVRDPSRVIGTASIAPIASRSASASNWWLMRPEVT
jgi:hypothetical protein